METLKYKCRKCGKTFEFSEMHEEKLHFENGSIVIKYLCVKCYNLIESEK